MKKILAAILVLAMIVCMSIPAFAAPTQPGAINITATYNKAADSTDTTPVYSVDVAYDNTVFVYTVGADTLKWDPESLSYSDRTVNTTGSWDHNSATITITNRSNAAVAITASADNNFTVTASANCASAEGKTAQTLPTATLTVDRKSVV